MAFFEKGKWGVRAAYNWRDEFLTGRFDGTGLPNPVYTEAYGQLDISASFNATDSLTFQAEVINLTDEIQRLHGRNDNQALYVTQTGATVHDRSPVQLRELAFRAKGCTATSP